MPLCTGGFIMNEYSSTFTDISHVEFLKNSLGLGADTRQTCCPYMAVPFTL